MIETQSAAGLSEPQPEAMVSAEGFRVRRWLGVGLLALLGVLLAILWAQWPSQVARSRMQEAERRMTAIGKAVLNYAQVHERCHNRLSRLWLGVHRKVGERPSCPSLARRCGG